LIWEGIHLQILNLPLRPPLATSKITVKKGQLHGARVNSGPLSSYIITNACCNVFMAVRQNLQNDCGSSSNNFLGGKGDEGVVWLEKRVC